MKRSLVVAPICVLVAVACGDSDSASSPQPEGDASTSIPGVLPDGAVAPSVDGGPNGGDGGGVLPTVPGQPALTRGGAYMGFPERFNRYYTDAAWAPQKTLYVSPTGTGNGSSRTSPMSVTAAVSAVTPGTEVYFLRGAYTACIELTKATGGTYDAPVVFYAERNPDTSQGVTMNCCATGRQSCFNLENADYVAIDGFELVGGRYGVRAVGEDYPASKHSRGVAVLDCHGHDQDKDPFFTGHSDWDVWEKNIAHDAKAGDGHGIYLSNGSDWNIVRYNETYSNFSSDFQINADPLSTCASISVTDAACDAYAGTGEGGQGASDYFLVDSNFFHHGTIGANFTSVRRSLIRNNIFGFQARHGVSFWQETQNPKLGSSDNKVLHNLFVTTDKHAVQFINDSTRNEFTNNVLLAVTISGAKASANPSALLMEVDATVSANQYKANLYVSGTMNGRAVGPSETARPDFASAWFSKFPVALARDPNDFKPTPAAPFLGQGTLLTDAPNDRNGVARGSQPDLGPIELP